MACMMDAPRETTAPLTDPLLLDNQLCYALYAAAHRMTKSYRPMLERMGLTYPQYLVLLVLWEQDGLSVKEIGQKLFLDSGTLTPLLKRLQAAGIVERTRDTGDERLVRITLTQKGRDLQGPVKQAWDEVVCSVGLAPDEFEVLKAQITRLRDTLHANAA